MSHLPTTTATHAPATSAKASHSSPHSSSPHSSFTLHPSSFIRLALPILTLGVLLAAPTPTLRAQSAAITADPNTGTLRSPLSLWQANAQEIAAALSLGNYVVPPSRTLTAGTGLTGGGNLSANRTISLANTSVTASTYGGASKAVSFSVDAQGRLTSAANQTITPVGIGALANSGSQTLNGSLTVSDGGALGGNWTYKGNAMVVGSSGVPGWAENAQNAVLAGLATTAQFLDPFTMPYQLDPIYAKRGLYATFNIPLGGAYTDFELKASAVNFVGGGMAFFYHSPDPGKSVIPSQIWSTRPDVFFTDSQYVKPGYPEENQRVWRKQDSSHSIADLRTNGNSVIAGVVVVVRDTAGALNSANAALVWSYCRMTPTGYEEDAGGKSIWHPIQPEWIAQPIAP